MLEMITINAKRHHLFIALAYFNSMIYLFKIEFNKVHSTHKTIQHLIN